MLILAGLLVPPAELLPEQVSLLLVGQAGVVDGVPDIPLRLIGRQGVVCVDLDKLMQQVVGLDRVRPVLG